MNLSGHKLEKLLRIRKRQELLNKIKDIEQKRTERANRNKISAEKLRINQIKLNNPNERKFKSILKELNIDFEYQKPFYDYQRYVCVDFFIKDFNLIIEIDGEIHNKTQFRDSVRSNYLKKFHNINRIMRISNKDLALNPKFVKDRLINIFKC